MKAHKKNFALLSEKTLSNYLEPKKKSKSAFVSSFEELEPGDVVAIHIPLYVKHSFPLLDYPKWTAKKADPASLGINDIYDLQTRSSDREITAIFMDSWKRSFPRSQKFQTIGIFIDCDTKQCFFENESSFFKTFALERI